MTHGSFSSWVFESMVLEFFEIFRGGMGFSWRFFVCL